MRGTWTASPIIFYIDSLKQHESERRSRGWGAHLQGNICPRPWKALQHLSSGPPTSLWSLLHLGLCTCGSFCLGPFPLPTRHQPAWLTLPYPCRPSFWQAFPDLGHLGLVLLLWLVPLGWKAILVFLGLRDFLGCEDFSAEIRTVTLSPRLLVLTFPRLGVFYCNCLLTCSPRTASSLKAGIGSFISVILLHA